MVRMMRMTRMRTTGQPGPRQGQDNDNVEDRNNNDKQSRTNNKWQREMGQGIQLGAEGCQGVLTDDTRDNGGFSLSFFMREVFFVTINYFCGSSPTLCERG